MTVSGASIRVWDAPLRVWHWSFAACVSGSLYTGLAGDIGLLQWHQRCGYGALGLLTFRLGWLFWGGLHARWNTFRLTPARVMRWLRGAPVAGPRTPPGAALVLAMLLTVGTQAVAGLFTSDFIFTDGPLVRYAPTGLVETMSSLHHGVFWLIIGLIGVHLTAHMVYGIQGIRSGRHQDSIPLSMFTGRKHAVVRETPNFWLRAIFTAGAVAALAAYALAKV